MVTSCVIYKCSDKHKKDCKVGYFRLPAVRKDANTETLALLKERRVWLTRINRPSDNLSEAQLAEVNSTIRICILLMVGAAMSLEFVKSQINSGFSEQITTSHSHTVSLLI